MTRLKEIRKSLKLSQEQMAALLHISRRSYGMYERGERSPGPAAIRALSRLLRMPPEQIFQHGREKPVLPENTEEENLLKLYRSLDDSGKQFVYQAAVFEQPLSDIYLDHRSPFGR